MAILSIQTLPQQVTLDQVLSVTRDISAGGPPAGGISHAVIIDGGRVKVFDVWESQEAMDAFTKDRLVPAIQKLIGGVAASQLPPPEVQIFEAHDAMGAPGA
jgi:hypothetical protein